MGPAPDSEDVGVEEDEFIELAEPAELEDELEGLEPDEEIPEVKGR